MTDLLKKCNTPSEYEVMPGTRDPYHWPFARNSIWNTPIGSDAEYKPAGFQPEPAFGIDKEIVYTTDESDELLEICNSRNGRWPTDEKDIVHTGSYMYWPRGLIFPATSGNACCAIIQPDGHTIIQIQPTCRADVNSKHIVGWSRAPVDLLGEGLYGTHWGSGLSSLGGSIRLGELISDEPLHHALKLNILAKVYAYIGDEVPGFRWPADRHDGYATYDRWSPAYYGGTDPELTMGSLVAIPPEVTPESLKLRTDLGRKIFHALQDYGAYIVDDSAWESYDLSAEFGVREEVQHAYGIDIAIGWAHRGCRNETQWNYYHDLSVMIRALNIVVNSSPDNIGGGGKPRAPLAPDMVFGG